MSTWGLQVMSTHQRSGLATINSMNDPELFNENDIRVTPTWLTVDGTSHAMHTLTKVQLAEKAVPRGSWTGLFYVSLVLILLSAFTTHREHMPQGLGMLLLVASLMLCLAAAWYAFVARDIYRLVITLNDGKTLPVVRPNRAHMMRLEQAIREALVMHRGLFRESMADMHIRHAREPGEQANNAADASTRRSSRPSSKSHDRRDKGKGGESTKPSDAAVRRVVVASAAARAAANGE